MPDDGRRRCTHGRRASPGRGRPGAVPQRHVRGRRGDRRVRGGGCCRLRRGVGDRGRGPPSGPGPDGREPARHRRHRGHPHDPAAAGRTGGRPALDVRRVRVRPRGLRRGGVRAQGVVRPGPPGRRVERAPPRPRASPTAGTGADRQPAHLHVPVAAGLPASCTEPPSASTRSTIAAARRRSAPRRRGRGPGRRGRGRCRHPGRPGRRPARPRCSRSTPPPPSGR